MAEDIIGGIMKAGEPGGKDPRESLLPEDTVLAGEEPDEAASQEEQEQYDTFMDRALKVLYSDKMLDTVIQNFRGADPVEAVGQMVSMVVMRVIDAVTDAGDSLTDDVMFHGAKELTEDMLEMHSKINGSQPTEEQTEGAFSRVMLELVKLRSARGQIDPAKAESEFGEMAAAERQGGLDQMLPGISAGGAAPSPAAMGARPEMIGPRSAAIGGVNGQ